MSKTPLHPFAAADGREIIKRKDRKRKRNSVIEWPPQLLLLQVNSDRQLDWSSTNTTKGLLFFLTSFDSLFRPLLNRVGRVGDKEDEGRPPRTKGGCFHSNGKPIGLEREMMENPWQPYSGWLNNNILPPPFLHNIPPPTSTTPFPHSYMIFRLNA